MFCINCGTGIFSDQRFCTSCGTALDRDPIVAGLPDAGVSDDRQAAERTPAVPTRGAPLQTAGTPRSIVYLRWALVGVAVLAVVIAAALRGGQTHLSEASSASSADIASAGTTLKALGSSCHIKTAGGQEIEFENLPINRTPDDTVSSNEVCTFARDAAARWDRESVDDTRSICQITGPAVFAKLGVTNWSGVAIRARSDRDAPDRGVGLEEFAEGCLNPTTIGVKIAESHSYLRIFSIGSIVWNAHRCRAYVRELMHADQQRGDSDLYELIGTRACARFPTNSQPDATDENPNPSPPGDYWRTAYQYSGPLPVEAKYHGHTYAFATGDNTVDIETTTVVSHTASVTEHR